jgi:hypothetical protein
MSMIKRKWYIIHVNCDCASYDLARIRRPGLKLKCLGCKKVLGPMQFNIMAEGVKAYTSSGAIEMYNAFQASKL